LRARTEIDVSKIYLSPPHMGARERELLLEAFDSNWIAPLGPHVEAFERELATFTGSAHALALASGTAALHLALQLVGVRPGDRVVVSDLTFVATANAVRYLGAEPVFVDADRDTWCMDAAQLDRALERFAPRAAVIVDLYGQCADYDALLPLCRDRGIPVIEDAAEALGACYRDRAAGTLGDLGVFSFNGNKIITTSGGGMLVSERADWIARARYLATQAREPVAHYEHREVGYNYRLSNLLAAVGRGQLAQLPERIARRHAINALYRELLAAVPGISFMPFADYGRPNAWLTCLTVNPDAAGTDRDAILRRFAAADIEARPVWKPMHLQPVYAGAAYVGSGTSARLFETGLCLPSGSALTDDDVRRIAAIVRDTARRQPTVPPPIT
jgi:dTDP-4-amino-4,6-dideoxygalactose transaminase